MTGLLLALGLDLSKIPVKQVALIGGLFVFSLLGLAGLIRINALHEDLSDARQALVTSQIEKSAAQAALDALRRQHALVQRELSDLERANEAAMTQWSTVRARLDQVLSQKDDFDAPLPILDLNRLNGDANRMLEDATRAGGDH